MVKIAVVGATGAVGWEVTKLLETTNMRLGTVRFFASAKSAEAKFQVTFRGQKYLVEDLAKADFSEFDIAIFSIGSNASLHYAFIAQAAGCIVIDNSSAFRMYSNVPLVVPEINAHALKRHSGIIANPNCTTAITMMALYPLHKAFGAEWIKVTSYQAASGAGNPGLDELRAQLVTRHGEISTGDGVWRQKMHTDVFPQPIALNVFPHIGTFLPNGSTDEEMKMLNEGRKIMGHSKLQATTTCVRVGTERVHCMDVLAHFERPVDMAVAEQALKSMPGLDMYEHPEYPTALNTAGKHNCAVGRIRYVDTPTNSLCFWVVGDQLLKGAALNAVQIAECLGK